MLLQWVLSLIFFLLLVIFVVVFLVLPEDLWICGQVLLVGSPVFLVATTLVVGVVKVEVDRGDIVVVYSVLDVLEVFMGHWHTDLTEQVSQLILWVFVSGVNQVINGVNNLTECLLGLLTVDLRQLLGLQFVLGHQMLLFLSEVSQVFGWRTCPDLTSWHSHSLLDHSTS